MDLKFEKNSDAKAAAENLRNAGCSQNFINQYLKLGEQGQEVEQQRHLACYRCALLDKIHTTQKKLDCLDYFIYTTKKEQPGRATKAVLKKLKHGGGL